MDIGAPLYKLGMFGDDASLAVAAALGVGFGFFLERAGFGSARKLTAQFYLTDMSVLKVMFTAIVTAMVGVAALSAIGWLDFSKIYLVPTYVVPQVAAGFVFGVGFIVGGYCPGTSVAGIATGRIDAGVYAIGMLTGIFLYAESFNAFFAGWAEATPLGQVTLPAMLGVAPGLLVAAVVLMALGAFALAERVEAAFRRPG
ncbi:MAG: YeeE/YedE thiosulfate transporter family protein [Pseudomonadota bacterium]